MLHGCRVSVACVKEQREDVVMADEDNYRIVAQAVDPRQMALHKANEHRYFQFHIEQQRIRGKKLCDLCVRRAIRVFVEKGKGGAEIGRRLLKRLHAEAFVAGHRQIGKGFAGAVGLAVMMRQRLGHFDQAIVAAALDFFCNSQVQRLARLAQ